MTIASDVASRVRPSALPGLQITSCRHGARCLECGIEQTLHRPLQLPCQQHQQHQADQQRHRQAQLHRVELRGRARQHTGLTVDALGAKASLLPRRVQKFEDGGGASPAREEIHRLARALDVEPLWLMAGAIAGEKFAPVWEGGGR